MKSMADKNHFHSIGLKNRLQRLLNTLFLSKKCTELKFKNLIELALYM